MNLMIHEFNKENRLNIIHKFKAAYNFNSKILRFRATGMSRRSLVDRPKFQRKLLTPFLLMLLSLFENHAGVLITVGDSPDGTDYRN